MRILFALFIFFTSYTFCFSQSDKLSTPTGEVTITPVLHGTLVLQQDQKTIYIDPYGGAELFKNFPDPDLVLITHPHGDHLNPETLKGITLDNTKLIAPQSVVDNLGDVEFSTIQVLKNDETTHFYGINIQAFPMYNLPGSGTIRHEKGWGNGYILTFGDKKVYISGDTEDIPEMRALKDIDMAFVCMNLPYTMDVESAASAVIEFGPGIVYPYHFRGGGGKFSDVDKFKSLVNARNKNVEVRLRDWYPGDE
ncbi:MBL fold metallo-hydrolase [Membranihabitans maritimus]|uniref:MBL fold metallo-hydrolase n=1 Tax=Membranihabitans maritimus TaxID=2904244 RepID=UPI001F26DEA9|nr:MBL fold metallo-hydrolase [Membranihabitans maritimus]